jgi:1-acyl-sn-glycerol-3-phosphate acyltransferase
LIHPINQRRNRTNQWTHQINPQSTKPNAMMAIGHIGAWKAAIVIGGAVWVVAVAVEPTVKVAIIAIIPLTITSIGGLWMQFLTWKSTKAVHATVAEVKVIAKQAEVNSNDMLTKLQSQKDAAMTRADRAEGQQQERQERRQRDRT